MSDKLITLVNATSEPDKQGFDAQKLANVSKVVQRGLDERIYPVAVWLVMRGGAIVTQGALGNIQPNVVASSPATLDTIFDVASITKMFTAALLLQHAEAGDLHLGQRIIDFLPESDGSPAANLTLRQLATHTSGLPPWIALHAAKRGRLAEIFAAPLTAEPGTRYAYSDLGYILLGEILTRLTQTPLDPLGHKRIFQPCDMTRTGYRPSATLRPQIAATANCPARPDKILVGEVHDANAWSMGGVAGHAGVFSTATDLARFFHSLQTGKIFHSAARHLFQENQIDPKIGGHSIGCFTSPNPMLPHGDLLSKQTFGHTGFTGTLFLHDPDNDITLILLTNRVYCQPESGGISKIRRQFANAVAGAIKEFEPQRTRRDTEKKQTG